MDLLNNFKRTLVENDKLSSKVTLKNYLADARKFISWYEIKHQRLFPPPIVTQELIESYLEEIRAVSPRSAKRYQSSLRKFFSYLMNEQIIPNNPLTTLTQAPITLDPWYLKDFSNFLYNSKASNHTIKNYIIDVRNFLSWVEMVSNDKNALLHIDSYLIQIYKNRLITEAQLSPISVNRKLSSLRKYINWGIQKGIFKASTLVTTSIPINHSALPEPLQPELADLTNNLPLEALQAIQRANLTVEDPEEIQNSRFGPIRLLNRTKNAANIVFDSLIVLSVIKSIEAVKYNLWKGAGREVFVPINTMIGSQAVADTAKSVFIKPLSPTLVDKFISMGELAKSGRIRGIPKSMYAPLNISTAPLPFLNKVTYKLNHNRPNWYKRYHSYPFVHYLHFALALIFATFAGFTLYKSFSTPTMPRTILASRVAPGRLISFQGKLNDLANNPITHESPVRFAIYRTQTDSEPSLLWQENQTIVPDEAGNFSTVLGKTNKISQDVFLDNPHIYLGISIGSDPELKPRLELANAGLTQSAQELQGLKPITGNNAGTSNVILALDSSGNLTIGGSAAPVFQATGGELKLTGQQLTLATNIDSNTNIVIKPDGLGIIDVQKPLQNTSNDNNVLSALGAVEVDDNFAILASTSAQSALVVNQNSTGDIISASSGGIAKFTLTNQGAGIFAGDLSIIGNNLTTTRDTFNLANTNTLNLNIGNAATSISIGANTGTTTINNNLKVTGLLNANGGISLPSFSPGSIPFINSLNILSEDRTRFFWDENNKRLGIGTSAPSYKISVIDQVSGSVAAITNSSLSDSVTTNVLRLNSGVSASGTQARFITFYANCSSENCSGTGVGNIHHVTNGIALQSGTADFAERLNVPESTEPGDVIGTNTITNRKSLSGDSLLGVVSDSAIVIGNSPENVNKSTNPIVGLLGQVRTKVSTEAGAIKKGDFLTSSGMPGIAKKATKPVQALGTALEDFNGDGTGKILVLVRPGWFQPEAGLMANGSIESNQETKEQTSINTNTLNLTQNYEKLAMTVQEFVDTLKTGVLEAKSISTQSLSVATEDITIGGQTIRGYISSIVGSIVDKKIAENNKKQISIVSPVAIDSTSDISPTPTPILTSSPSAQLNPNPQTQSTSPSITNITNIYNTASNSAIIASQSAAPAPTTIPEANPTPAPINTASVSAQVTIAPSLAPTPNPDESSSSQASASASALTKSDILNIQYAKVASYSAELAYIPNLKSDFSTVNQGLVALGPTSLTDTSINGQLSIGSSMKLSDTSINTIGGDLNLQPLRQGNLSIMGGLVTIDTEGNLTVNGNAAFAKDVTVKGKFAAGLIVPVPNQDLIFQVGDKENSDQGRLQIQNASGSGVLSINHLGDLISSGSGKFADLKIVRGAQADTSFTETVASGSAGTATITAHETERTIITKYVNSDSLIYLTPVSSVQGSTPYVARQVTENPGQGTKSSFTIQIASPAAQDIKINWWIVN